MEFGLAITDAVKTVRAALHEAFELKALKKATFSRLSGVSRGKLEKFVTGGELSIDDFCLVYTCARTECRKVTDLTSRPAIAGFLEFDTEVSAHENDIRYSRFGKLLRSKADTGDVNDLMRLKGVYFVMRRNGRDDSPINVSAIKIEYDAHNNICTWENSQGSHPDDQEIVHGLITQSRGVFYFFGFMEDTTVLHAMSVYKLSKRSGKFLGVVLTTNLRNPIVSRVVMIQTELSFQDAVARGGVITEAKAKKLGLDDLALIDNSCHYDGVISALEDLPSRMSHDPDDPGAVANWP